MSLRYLSVCSGIEAATVAFHPLGWSPVAFAEIEPFPCAVLAHHYGSNLPGESLATNGVPNLGDITRFQTWPDLAIDLLVGGTPCQSFSVAGLRKGLADPRGNLALTYLAIADRYRPRWLLWENVPGVLSSGDGRDFGSFLGGLGQLGYGFAYRVLDAQYVRVDGFGRAVPQRRRRVFVVGHLGDWRRAAAVLFDAASLCGDPDPEREAGARFAASPTLRAGGNRTGGDRPPGTDVDTAESLIPFQQFGSNIGPTGKITGTLPKGNGNESGGVPCIAFDTTQITSAVNRSQPKAGDPCHPLAAGAHPPAIAFNWQAGGTQTTLGYDAAARVCGTIQADQTPAIAFQSSQSGVREGDTHATLDANMGSRRHNGAVTPSGVRRLTPRECERLQGFPDDFTAVPFRGKAAADGPRYKALGNSMAVNVMRWIGTRIAQVDAIASVEVAA